MTDTTVIVRPSVLAQHIVADLSIVFAILTTALAGIHLPPLASAILGVFGILLHPQTSITTTTGATAPPTPGAPAP